MLMLLQIFLDELHASGKLNSTSLWKDLYPIISVEERYRDLLGQPGMTDSYLTCIRSSYTIVHAKGLLTQLSYSYSYADTLELNS